MDRRLIPVALGLGAGVVQFALPTALASLALVVAVFAAGWFLPEAPMKAALLFLLPAAVLGLPRVLLDDDSAPIGSLLFGSVVAVMFAAILTHIGAGVAVRRQGTDET